MKNLFIKAHKMTREIKEQYNEVDYQVQFGLCLSYLHENKEEKKMIKKLAEEKIRKFAKSEAQAEKHLSKLAGIDDSIEMLDKNEQMEMLKEAGISIKFREPIRRELFIEEIAKEQGAEYGITTVEELRRQMEENGEN